MDIAAVGRDLAQHLGIGHLVVQQLLCLRAVGAEGLIADTKGTVGSDPPVLGSRMAWSACWQQLTFGVWHAIHLLIRLRQAWASDVRATCRQSLQPVRQLRRASQGKAAPSR